LPRAPPDRQLTTLPIRHSNLDADLTSRCQLPFSILFCSL
jgi:hypothetical protein